MSGLYYAAACQTSFACPTDRSQIAARTKRMGEIIEHTIVGYEPFFDVRLLVFPEFAHAAPVYDTVEKLRERLAVPVPNEHTRKYEDLAKKYGCYIQTGTFLEVDEDYPDAVFNTTALIGPGGLLTKYRKVNPWIPWEVHASPHDFVYHREHREHREEQREGAGSEGAVGHQSSAIGKTGTESREPTADSAFASPSTNPSTVSSVLSRGESDFFPVADTEIGRLGVAICYDWLFPESIRQIAFNGAEVLIRVSAYMDPWGATPPMDWWTLFNRARAAENTAYVVASNQGATLAGYPPFSWPGGSMVVDYDGRVLAQADPGEGEKVVVAPIDIDRLRAERARRVGHDMRSHLRTEAHPYMQQSYLKPAGGEAITIESLRERIGQAKRFEPQRRRDTEGEKG